MKRKPKIQMIWSPVWHRDHPSEADRIVDYVVNWHLVGGNGETMCQSNQGFRDKTDALRSIDACASYLFNSGMKLPTLATQIKGPGRKPK